MPATIRLVTGPFGSGKTERLLARYREVATTGIGAALWLLPTDRDRDPLRRRIGRLGAGILAPNLLTLSDFARQVVRAGEPSARPVPELHQRLLLAQVLAAAVRDGDVPAFAAVAESRGFADAVFAVLTELKGQGVTPSEFEETGRRLMAERGRDNAVQIARLYARYQKRLADRQLFDREATYARARELWVRGKRGSFAAVRAVFVDGFADFTPPQLGLIGVMGESVEQIWVTIPAEHDGHRAEVFSRPAATLDRLRRHWPGAVSVQTDFIPERPSALAHLRNTLFGGAEPARGTDADGLRVVEAAGPLGEVRMAARAVKQLLIGGAPVDSILVTARDLNAYADLVQEVFAEYGIPVEVDGTLPLTRSPAIATLLRAARLADDGFPFAATGALLRSGYLRPAWPDVITDPDAAAHAEILLRLLGEPKGGEAYLRLARTWAAAPEPGLEDEQAEESRRRRKHELAKRCLPFLERFFRAWNDQPDRGSLESYCRWLSAFADDLGLTREPGPAEAAAWARFWTELDGWAAQERNLHPHPPRYTRSLFRQLIGTLAATAGLPRTPAGPGRVRVLPAEQARHMACDHLFILGLGERSFPKLQVYDPIFDDDDRRAFRAGGVDLRCAADRLPAEMLLFVQLVTRPGRGLVLSYPAVDDKGQDLLPSSFLTAAVGCFADGVVPVERRRMLIEGYDHDPPLSPAEYRVRWAATSASDRGGISDDLFDHLRSAARMVCARFESREYSEYDGLLRAPGVVADVRARFGPTTVVSPTALETYVACPFRFFADQVIKLEPLEDPAEEVEHTRRGAAVHRALARLHGRLKAENTHVPDPDLDERLLSELRAAVDEYAGRASSPAMQVLWRLEAARLERTARRYGGQWGSFVEKWVEQSIAVRPHDFEIDFGTADSAQPLPPLTIRVDGIEVRIGGRIDRIDVATLDDGTTGFWVIDYKTGKSHRHTGAGVRSMEKLQLALYALAVERVVHAGARPLGVAYWLIADGGPRAALPHGRSATAWLTATDQWPRFRDQLERWVAKLVGRIRDGEFPLKPRSEDCAETCPYSQMCRISQSRSVIKNWDLELPAEPAAHD